MFLLFKINNEQSQNEIKQLKKYLSNDKPNKTLNLTGLDIKLLDETNQSAILVFLKNLINKSDNYSNNNFILTERNDFPEQKSNFIYKGNFKYKFEIIPKKQIFEPLKISVGFEIDFFDETDINYIEKDEDDINDDIKIDSSYETIILLRHFNVYKKTNIIHVLLNISCGKFFIIGESELEKRNNKIYLSPDNCKIIYLRNFNKINLDRVKNVRPIFKYNKNDIKRADININGNNLGENKI